MSQQEFDTYLSLLCRLLRIAPRQREQVAEEFRAHMEDRLEELLARGMDREEAVKLALEEFGDAAGLAAQIVSISQGRRKRWIMRIGTISVAGLAAAGLLAVALWPEGAQVKAPQAIAQSKDKEGAAEEKEKTAKGQPERSVEEKLAQRLDVDYSEISLQDVLNDLKERADIQIYINRKAISAGDDTNGSLEATVTINLKQVRLDMILDLALEQAGEGHLAYVERDGILMVSTSDALSGASEVKVYNCRDLLAMSSPVPGGGMMGGGDLSGPGNPGGEGGSSPEPGAGASDAAGGTAPPGPSGTKSAPRNRSTPSGGGAAGAEIPKGIAPQFGGGGGAPPAGGGGGGGDSSPPRSDEEIRAERLMHLITTAVKPDSWQDMGGFGTISEYKGLIVINHNARTHQEVENVLQMLREAAGLPDSEPAGGFGFGGGMPRGVNQGGFF
jgi:hypothetical protein